MMAQNIAAPFSDSFEATAKEVKAKLMVVASAQDHMVNPTPALQFAGILQAEVVELKGELSVLCGLCQLGWVKSGRRQVALKKTR